MLKKKIYIVTGVFLLFIILLEFNPYHFYHKVNAEKKVATIFNDPVFRQGALGTESPITSVTYLGSHFYEVDTGTHTFPIKILSNKSTHTIDVYTQIQPVGMLSGYTRFALVHSGQTSFIYNFNTKGKIERLFSDNDFRHSVLGEDSPMTNVKSIGSTYYEVETKNNGYLIKLQTDNSSTTFFVFSPVQQVKQFIER